MTMLKHLFTLLKFRARKLSVKDRQQQASNPAFVLNALVLLAFTLSLLDSILGWVSLLVLCSTAIRAAIYFAYQKHLPSQRTMSLLALLSAIGLAYSAIPLGLLVAMVNLLVMACALKLMQLRSQRDFYQFIVSLLFLLGCGFIFNQSIAYSLFYALLIFAVVLSLAWFHAPARARKPQVRYVALMCLQAAPIAILLFLVLPQLPPLWQTPKAKSAQTGLTEKVTPGDIASLSQSSKLAFRATFNGTAPAIAERYWRAIVMEDFDGRSWQVNTQRKQQIQLQQQGMLRFSPQLTGPFAEYDVIAEPTQQRWLFGLDIAVPDSRQSQNEIWQSPTFQLVKRQPVSSAFQYTLRSYTQAMANQPLDALSKAINTDTPRQGNPRTRQWVSELRRQYPHNPDFIRALMQNFAQQPFIYTLRPRPMPVDPVDAFLFDQQAGFCSHYASALAYSLRLGGIPARLVTGYQGGELLAKPDQAPYLSVYQYDAHAWVEAYDAQAGWQRLDPTAMVAPDRITQGLRQAMEQEGSFLADSPFALARLSDIAIFNQLRLWMTDMDYNWSRWVIGFDKQKQLELFKALVGELNPWRLALLGGVIVLIIGLILLFSYLPQWLAGRRHPLQHCYQQALSVFAQAGFVRPAWGGPLEFEAAVQRHFSADISQCFNAFNRLYLAYVYRPHTTRANRQLRRTVRDMRRHLKHLKKLLSPAMREAQGVNRQE